MAAGTAFGGACYATQQEAADMACSAVAGVSAAGAVSCSAHDAVSGSGGGSVAVGWTQRVVASGGATTESHPTMQLMGCETYGADYWEPLVAAAVTAAIAVKVSLMAARRIFGDRATY